jgi:hypothetical protein
LVSLLLSLVFICFSLCFSCDSSANSIFSCKLLYFSFDLNKYSFFSLNSSSSLCFCFIYLTDSLFLAFSINSCFRSS